MIHNIKNKLSLLGVLIIGIIISSCNNEINLSGIDESGYNKAGADYVALKNTNDPRPMRMVELRSSGDRVQVNLQLSQAFAQDYTANLSIDQTALTDYNTINSTSFDILPTSNAVLEATSVTVTTGSTKSAPVNITLKGDGLTVGTTYALPVSFTNSNADVKVSTGENSYIFLIKYMGDVPDASKATGIKTFMIYEINGNNPVNACEWTLTGTPNGVDDGKPFADVVVLFSANINFNAATGKVYILTNPQVTAILNNRDKYIKPLQDKGIKVLLSILGNHDQSGVANLDDAAARDYAQQLKAIVDVYGLDGTFYDDEWSAYATPVPPGFTRPSSDSFARLCYYAKAAMPDKMIALYSYGYGSSMRNPVVDDNGVSHNPSEFIDYAIEATYSTFATNLANNYKGMTNTQVSPYSRDITQGIALAPVSYYDFSPYYTVESLQQVRNGGYGAFTLYDPVIDWNTIYYQTAFNNMAKYLYDGQIVFSGNSIDADYNE